MRRFLLPPMLVGLLVLFLSISATPTLGAAPVRGLTINPTIWNVSAPVGQYRTTAFTLTYSGKGNTGRLSGVFTATSSSAFSYMSGTCEGATLSSRNPTCIVQVKFQPTSVTTYSAEYVVSGRTLSASASLSGTGQSLPTLSVNDPAAISYGINVNFTVTRSGPPTTAVTFDWATADGTAVSGSSCNGSTDYIGGSGIRTIAAGVTSLTIAIATCSDGPGNMTPYTGNFTLTISNPSGATITKGTGIATLNPS